jgi:PilZ domain-containing protein
MADSRKSEPTGAERRDSPRVPMKFLVRDKAEGGSFEEYDGDLAVGGAFFKGRYPPGGNLYEVRFHLPGMPKDVRVTGELLRIREDATSKGYHLKFKDVDLASELAIAKYLDDLARK